MQFCQDHWDRLREAIDDRGLTALIADTGSEAAHRLSRSARGEDTIDTFEPLMEASLAIAANAGTLIETAGGTPAYWYAEGPEDPIDISVYGVAAAGRTWPKCPLCCINVAHELSCGGCALPKKGGYDYFIGKAADDMLARWESFRE